MWPFSKKKKKIEDPWEHLEVERKKIIAECAVKKPNPGIHKCHRCVYLHGSVTCPKYGGILLAKILPYNKKQNERGEHENNLNCRYPSEGKRS